MATRSFIGAGANIRQTYSITMAGTGDWVAADTITSTVANIAFVTTVGSLVTDAQVATTVFQALSGATLTDTTASATIGAGDVGATAIPQFGTSEFNATNPSAGVVLLTGGPASPSPAWLAGKPFTIAITENTTGDETATGAAVVTPTSQAHWDQPDNWSGNTVPVDSDVIAFDTGNVDLLYALTTAIQPLTVNKSKQYTGNVGLAYINVDNPAKPYAEYRTPLYLTFDDNSITTTLNLETGTGQGSSRFMVDNGAGQAVVNVLGKGSRKDLGTPCILWKGTHAANIVRNIAGDIGIAFYAGETAVVATLTTGDSSTSQAETVCGSGVTLTTVTLNGGKQETSSAITTAVQNGGNWTHLLGTVTALTINAGTYYPNGAATHTTITVRTGGKLDCRKGTASFTVTNPIQLFKGAEINDPNGRMGNFAFVLNGCNLEDVTIITPYGKTFTIS